MDVDAVPSAAQSAWETLLEEAEKVEDLSSLISGAFCGRRGHGGDGRQNLLKFVAEHKGPEGEGVRRPGAGGGAHAASAREGSGARDPATERPTCQADYWGGEGPRHRRGRMAGGRQGQGPLSGLAYFGWGYAIPLEGAIQTAGDEPEDAGQDTYKAGADTTQPHLFGGQVERAPCGGPRQCWWPHARGVRGRGGGRPWAPGAGATRSPQSRRSTSISRQTRRPPEGPLPEVHGGDLCLYESYFCEGGFFGQSALTAEAHLTSVPQQGFAFSPQELATMMVWHGPTGGHVQHAAADFSLGERRHKTYDALDLGEQLWWCLCSLFEWINGHLGEAPATVERSSFFLAHFGALGLLLYRGSYSSKPARQRSRLGTSGHMARPLLCSVAQGGSPHGGEHTTIQQLGRLSGVGPAAAPPRPPSQTDLELWASGQLTMREQMVTAYDRLLRDRPLSHSAREAAPTNLEASADVMDGIPALTPEERRAVHISVWVATPFFEPEVIDMGLTRGSFCNAVKGTSWMLPDYVETIIPTTPQLSPFFGSCVAVPPWVQAADMSVFVVDGRRIGSQAYAIYQRGPVTKSSVARWLPEDDQDEVDVYCFGETVALGDGHHTQPIQGGIIQVVYQGEPCDWADTLEARPKDRPDRVPGPGQRQRRTAEDLLNYARGQRWLRSPTSPLVHVAHAGRRIVRQIAVNPGPRSTQLDDPDLVVVFADLRGLGFLSAMDYANGHRLRHAGLH